MSPWPTELRYQRASRRLEVDYDDGVTISLAAELLRVESPSAEVRGHGASRRQIVPGKRHVAVVRIEPVGNYAARIVFDDGHDSGLYTWAYLRELGRTQAAAMAAYEAALAARGLSREP